MIDFCMKYCPQPTQQPPGQKWISCDSPTLCPDGSVVDLNVPFCLKKRVINLQDLQNDYNNSPCVVVTSDGELFHQSDNGCAQNMLALADPGSTVYQWDVTYPDATAVADRFVTYCNL